MNGASGSGLELAGYQEQADERRAFAIASPGGPAWYRSVLGLEPRGVEGAIPVVERLGHGRFFEVGESREQVFEPATGSVTAEDSCGNRGGHVCLARWPGNACGLGKPPQGLAVVALLQRRAKRRRPVAGRWLKHVLDTVVLDKDLPHHGLQRGDLGAVVEVYEPDALDIEFVTASGRTGALVTVSPDDIRPVVENDLIGGPGRDVPPWHYAGEVNQRNLLNHR
jgi:hypothetical protein